MARPPIIGIAALAALALGGVVGARYVRSRKVSGAELLTEALLDTERLRTAVQQPNLESENLLAACADYVLNVVSRSSEGLGLATGPNDAVGQVRAQSHNFTGAKASVVTESDNPNLVMSYVVTIPDMAEISGTRTVGKMTMNGLTPGYPVPDNVQITLKEGYTAQLESDIHLAETLVTGNQKLTGAITLRDNQGNVGRVNLIGDGTVTGTITRDASIVGRFEGHLGGSIVYKKYQIGA